MEKFTVHIDLTLEEIYLGYRNFYGSDKKPTRKDIAQWISNLAEADIMDCASHENDDEDE
jgi:hypothetical protein